MGGVLKLLAGMVPPIFGVLILAMVAVSLLLIVLKIVGLVLDAIPFL